MVNLIRRFQQPLLILLTIFVIVTFVILYNLPNVKYGGGGPQADRVATLYGRAITRPQFERVARRFSVVTTLMLFDYFSLAGSANSRGQAEDNVIWNTFVLEHEAEELGIRPTQDEIDEAIKQTTQFKTNGVFDYTKFALFQHEMLAPRGFTGDELSIIIGDNLRLKKIKELLGTSVGAAPYEAREAFAERYQKSEVSAVRFKFDEFKTAAQVADDDVKKLFEERKATLNTPEKRKVKYISFSLEKKEKPLTGRERAEAMEKLSEQAQEFAQGMTAKDAKFEAVAEKSKTALASNKALEGKYKVTVAESPAFAQAEPPTELERSAEAAAAGFHLSKAEPNSDAILAGNSAYVVLQLTGVEDSRPLTFDEAKAKLVDQLKEERGREAMNLKATAIRTVVETARKEGKSVAEAAKVAGANLEKLGAFSQSEPLKDPDAQTVAGVAAELGEGQLSEFTPTATGGMLVYLDKKLPIDEAAFEKEKPALETQITQTKKEALMRDWIEARRKVADLKLGAG